MLANAYLGGIYLQYLRLKGKRWIYSLIIGIFLVSKAAQNLDQAYKMDQDLKKIAIR